MQINRTHHVAIICSDYQKSKDFYTRILSFEIIKETYREARDSYKLDLRVGDHDQIELFSFPGAPARPSYPEAQGLRHLAFEVDNIEEAIKDLEKFGILCEPLRNDDTTGKRCTFFSDPDNQPLELYEK